MGRHARRLSTRRESIEAKTENVTTGNRRSPATRQSIERIVPITEEFEDDLEIGEDKWSSHFKKLGSTAVNLSAIASPEDDVHKKELSPKMQETIREIFNVYFEGDYTSWQNSIEQNTFVAFWLSIRGTMPWLQPWIEECTPRFLGTILLFSEICLRGIGQVFFQNNPISGLLILIGLFIQSTRVALHGVLAVIAGNLLAILLRFDTGLIRSGLFGYNSVLVGLALATFDSSEEHSGWYAPIPVSSIIFGSFSSILFVFMGKILVQYQSPPLTLPFNVATLIFLAGSAHMLRVQTGPVVMPSFPDYSSSNVDMSITAKQFFSGTIRGIGQVYLANKISSGLLIWAGIAVCSRISALAAFFGSALGVLVALATGSEPSAIEQGMFGFNPSLTVTAMFMFYVPTLGAVIFALMAGVMTVAGQQALASIMSPYGLPFMTLPVCAICLPFIIVQGTTPIVFPVPLSSMTVPEDHLERFHCLKDGFIFLLEAIDSSKKSSNVTDTRTNLKKLTKKSSKFTDELSQSLQSTEMNKNEDSKKGGFKLCGKSEDKNERVNEAASQIFVAIEDDSDSHMKLRSLIACLRLSGLDDKEGLHFVGLVFGLLDLDMSGALDFKEFAAFCAVSIALQDIHHRIARFADFVDDNDNSFVDLDEIDLALEYLGEDHLSPSDREALASLMGGNEVEEFSVLELTNLITVDRITSLVKDYHMTIT